MQVAVSAVGLNFRDVLNVLGIYPGDPGLPGEIHTIRRFSMFCINVHAHLYPAGLQDAMLTCSICDTGDARNAESHVGCTATGSDFAGTLLRCGSEQQAPGPPAWQVGDAVMGWAPGCLGTAVVAEQGTAARVAPAVSLAAAASLPTVAVTAEAAFALAGLQRGMRCAALCFS